MVGEVVLTSIYGDEYVFGFVNFEDSGARWPVIYFFVRVCWVGGPVLYSRYL